MSAVDGSPLNEFTADTVRAEGGSAATNKRSVLGGRVSLVVLFLFLLMYCCWCVRFAAMSVVSVRRWLYC